MKFSPKIPLWLENSPKFRGDSPDLASLGMKLQKLSERSKHFIKLMQKNIFAHFESKDMYKVITTVFKESSRGF